jgi:hypothetical protein
MKKYLSVCAFVCLALAMTGCGDKEKKEEKQTTIAETTTGTEITTGEEGTDVESESGTEFVLEGEEETIIGQGGTVLPVKKAKDASGKDIYVEEITDAKGKTSYKKVIKNKDGSVKFEDVEPNKKGQFVPKGSNGNNGGSEAETQKGDSGNEETKDPNADWMDGNENYNDDSNWSDMY